jgi:putative addiction module component (TIGR02574 family)
VSETDVAEILKLPPEERLRLVELIWENLATTQSDVPLGDAHRKAIDDELAEHRRNPDDILTLDQVVAEVRKTR